MKLDAIELETGPHPLFSIIVLHGLGADGNDFVSIAGELDLQAAGAVRFIFPHAPTRPVTVNNGYVMRAWYDIFGFDLVKREDEKGLRESQALVDAFIARENERGIPSSRIVVAGFSQGCAMTLMTGLRHPQRLAALVGLSGYLPLAAKVEDERHTANHDVPIFLAHGRNDPVVSIERGRASRDALITLGHDVEWHEYAMQHSVCAQEIVDLNHFLIGQLKAAA